MRHTFGGYILVFLFFLSSAGRCADVDPESAGRAAGEMALSAYGSMEGFNQRISRPLTSDDTPMTTLDGSRSFNARLSCPSSERFLEVFIQVYPQGDVAIITGQDTDLDGNIDYSYQVPFPVSGVCANGIISCDPGTWDNCRYYRWSTDGSGRIGVEEVYITELGGCYCINNDCGNNLVWSNLQTVLKDIGGGVVGSIQSYDPKYAVTDVSIQDTSITYYGQKSSQCTGLQEGGSTNPERYYDDPGLMGSDTSAEIQEQSSDPQSIYSLVSLQAERDPSEMRTCNIRRIVNYTGGKLYNLQFNTRLDDDCGLSWRWNSWLVVTNRGEVYPAPVGYSTIEVSSPSPDIRISRVDLLNCGYEWCPTVFSGDYGVTESWQRLWNWNCDNGNFIDVRMLPGYTCDSTRDEITEWVDDQCSALENDDNCRLMEEVVDGVYTWRDFNPTGITPLPTCRTFVDDVCSVEVCRDWWMKERLYLCKTGESFDFSDVIQRTDVITDTLQDDTTTMYYMDMRMDESGEWIYEENTAGLSSRDTFEDCQKACKTRVPVTDTQAGTTGHTGQKRTSTGSYEFFYRRCVDNVCPAGPGEEVVKDCQCISDFAEAASIMITLESASKDLICSSGVKR